MCMRALSPQGKWEEEAQQCSRLAHHLREGMEVPIERTERPAFMRGAPERPEVRLATIEGDLASFFSLCADERLYL